jgi:hypothetical protein
VTEQSETTPAADGSASADVAEALRALTGQVEALKEELESLRSDQSALPAVAPETPGWEHRPALAGSGPAWARSLDSPSARRPPVPRFALEVGFLAAVAVVAAAARLDPIAIVGTLAVAWALVALIEWLAWRTSRQQEALLAGISLGEPRVESDPSWFAPPIEQTAELDGMSASAAKLPPAQPE